MSVGGVAATVGRGAVDLAEEDLVGGTLGKGTGLHAHRIGCVTHPERVRRRVVRVVVVLRGIVRGIRSVLRDHGVPFPGTDHDLGVDVLLRDHRGVEVAGRVLLPVLGPGTLLAADVRRREPVDPTRHRQAAVGVAFAEGHHGLVDGALMLLVEQ